jgi:hypothetical protein
LHFLDIADVSPQERYDGYAHLWLAVAAPASVEQAVAHLPEDLAGVPLLLDGGKVAQQNLNLLNDRKREDLEIIRSILARAQGVEQTDDLLDSLSWNTCRRFDFYRSHKFDLPQ